MRRIAIIDHATHQLYVEDIPETILEECYDGQEEAYIKDNYTFEGDYSWDWITDAEYIPALPDADPIEIDFNKLID
jgi:hypothetical protein